MIVSFEYDQDPRYGWARVDLDGQTTGLIIVVDNGKHYAFNFCKGEMKPTCICHAYEPSECGCPNWSEVWEDV